VIRFALSLTAVLTLARCSGGAPQTPAPAPAAAPAPVEPGARVLARDPTGSPLAEAPARVVAGPGAAAVLSAPLRARVLKVRARAGDQIAAGAPLVDVVMPELLEAAARLRGARGRLAAAQARAAQLDALRAEGMARAADQSEAALKVAEAAADAEAARAVLLAAGVKEDEANRLLGGSGQVALKAPFAGVVSRVTAVVGEVREPGGQPLVELQSAGDVRVEARFGTAPALDAAWDFVGGDGLRLPLKPLSRSAAAAPEDGSRAAWFELPSEGAPAPGTPGRVVLRRDARAVLVPAAAIRRDGERTTVVKAGSGPVELRLLGCCGPDCLAQGPLSAGDALELPERGSTP
jgi:multidrug efflux pump subunit AcrA (membrane-fusion protein)